MRSIATIARNAVVIGALGIAAATAGPSFTSWAQETDGGCCGSTDGGAEIGSPGTGISVPGIDLEPSESTPGGGGGAGTIPKFEPPPEPKIDSRPVIIRKPPAPEVPPEVLPEPQPSYEPVPVDRPVPVNVEQLPVPVAPAPAPVEIQTLPAPAAPPVPAPVSRVLLTSSMQPGTQAITIILLFSVIGVWIYTNQIITQWSVGRKAHARASA